MTFDDALLAGILINMLKVYNLDAIDEAFIQRDIRKGLVK